MEKADDSAEGSTDVVMIGGVGFGVVIIILLTFLIVRKGRGGDGLAGDSYANAAFDQPMGGLAAADPSITPSSCNTNSNYWLMVTQQNRQEHM